MDIRITARDKNSGTEEYRLPEESGLNYSIVDVNSEDRLINISADSDFDGVIRIALHVEDGDKASRRFFLPGFMYGTNRGEAPLLVDSKAPRIRMKEDFPASPWWMVRSDRLSYPVAMMYGEKRIIGLSASPYYLRTSEGRTPWKPGITGEFDQYTGFGCSMEDGEIWYTLGYENAPWLFIDSHKISPRAELKENSFGIKAGETISVKLHIFDIPAEDERSIHDILKKVYSIYHQEPRRASGLKDAVKDMATAIMTYAWMKDEHSYTCFVFDREDHFEYRLLPSISWTNGLSAAVPMLVSGHRLGIEEMRSQAIDCIDHIVHCSMNERNDLPYLVEQDGVWSNHGWWYEKQNTPGHVAYLVGQSVYLILKAYEWEKDNGTIHDDWMEFAKRVIARTEKSRNQDGEYPYVLSDKTGAGVEYDSFSGAWCMAAAAYYTYLTGDRSYMEDMLRSEKYYHDTYIKHQECYAGPLDIDKNIDSEGILSYIRAVHYLHAVISEDGAVSGKCDKYGVNDARKLEEEILDHMRDALYYEYTFKFCYNSPIKVPPLSKVGWSSCGGSITSVTNPHIHPMSSSILDEMIYYLNFREDSYIRDRYMDTKLWSCQCHNTYDKEFDYGKVGWMSERFCHSEGLLTETYPDGSPASTWFALMPWAAGSILEGLTGKAWDEEE